ncbi:MAG TPA: tetratricopeptide repeat protein [Phycisphaerae bacterium]|nr:tetratricopeptide repeat protein [Phycisphaerae bacterium]
MPEARSRNPALPSVLIFAVAVSVRAVYLFQIRSMGFWTGLLSDAAVYVRRATQIARGDWLGPADFVHAPTYAYFLGILQLIGLNDLLAPRIAQIVLGSTSCILISIAAERLFDRRIGLIAGLLYAICPAMIFFDGEIQKTSLGAFFAALLLWQITSPASALRSAFCGLITALLILTQQSTLIFVSLILIWLALGSRPRLAPAIIFLAALGVGILPWVLRNRAVTGQITVTTPNLGQNFYMGNSPDATGSYLARSLTRSTGEFEQEAWTDEVAKAIGHAPTLAEVSDYYLHLAMNFIREHPAAWLRLLGKKILMTWNVYETGDTEDYYLYLGHSSLLRLLDAVFNFGVFGPLAIAGVVVTWGRRRQLWPLYLWAILMTIATAAFVVFARYRFPLMPIVFMFAAAAVVHAADALKSRQARRLIKPALIAICAASAMNWPIYHRRSTQVWSYVNHASALTQQSRYDEALAELDKSIHIAPNDIGAWLSRGSTLIDAGYPQDALEAVRRAESIQPDDSDVLAGLIAAHLAAGELDAARQYAQKALAHDSDDPRAKTGLATALARSGNAADAIALFKQVIDHHPKHIDAYVNLGSTYIITGQEARAAECWNTALELNPDNADALQNMARMEMHYGHSDRAAELFGHLLKVAPNRPGVREEFDEALRAASQPSAPRKH